jgi:gliding motility-associated-like protein
VLEALISFSPDSIAQVIWKTLPGGNCQDCLAQTVSPESTTDYSISIIDHAGCVVNDTLTVRVLYENDIHIPNVFSPNGDGINDRFLISGSAELEEIESLQVYDRWGSLVFAIQQFQPGDPDVAWDGKMHGSALDPAVFVYTAVVRWRDGSKELKQGDITLIR